MLQANYEQISTIVFVAVMILALFFTGIRSGKLDRCAIQSLIYSWCFDIFFPILPTVVLLASSGTVTESSMAITALMMLVGAVSAFESKAGLVGLGFLSFVIMVWMLGAGYDTHQLLLPIGQITSYAGLCSILWKHPVGFYSLVGIQSVAVARIILSVHKYGVGISPSRHWLVDPVKPEKKTTTKRIGKGGKS